MAAMPFRSFALLVLLCVVAAPSEAAEPKELWAALKQGGHVAVMRHAVAPGYGDPAGFRLEDCPTQRNPPDEGREPARRIGAAFRAPGGPVGPGTAGRRGGE